MFFQNKATWGGAVSGYALMRFHNCAFWANETYISPSDGDGGAIAANIGNVEIANCTFYKNKADDLGGALQAKSATIINSIFSENSAATKKPFAKTSKTTTTSLSKSISIELSMIV